MSRGTFLRCGPGRSRSAAAAVLAAVVVGLAGARMSSAITFNYTWNGGSSSTSNWSDGANWVGGSAPVNTGVANIFFAGNTRLSPDVNAEYSVNGITFNSGAGAFVIGDQLLEIGVGGITNNSSVGEDFGNNNIGVVGSQIWNASAGNLTFSAPIDLGAFTLTVTGSANTSVSNSSLFKLNGTGALTKTGTGKLILNGVTATYAGLTSVNQGELVLNLGSTGAATTIAGPVVIGTGTHPAGSAVFDDSDVFSPTGGGVALTNNAVTIFSDGELNTSGDTLGPVTMTGGSVVSDPYPTAFNGNVTTLVSGSTATISGMAGLGGATQTFTVAAGTTVSGIDLDVPALLYGTAGLIKGGAGTLRLSGANVYSGGTGLAAGTIVIGNNGALGTGALTVTTGASSPTIEPDASGSFTVGNAIQLQTTLYVAGTTNLTLTGAISNYGIPGGLTMVGTGTLTLAGANTFTLPVTVSSGTVVQDTALTCDVVNQASFIYNSGGGISGRLTNNGVATFNASFTAGNGMANNGLTIIAVGANVTLNGAGLNNQGSMGMVGGVLSVSQTAANTNGGSITLSGTTLLALGSAGVLNNSGSLYLQGTVVAGTTGQLNNSPGGVISGPGVIQSVLTNNGLIAIGPGTLTVAQAFNNPGTIQLTSSSLSGGAVSNTGTINGTGNIASAVTNGASGTIEATAGGILYVAGALTNNGLVTADAGSKLIVTGGLAANPGIVNLTGGIFDNNGFPMDNTGQVSGWGIFRFGGTGLTNDGSITFSGGTSTITGTVTNDGGEHLTVAYNPAIFTGNVTNNTSGTIKITSTTVTFAGTFTNNGTYTSDPATNVFQGNVVAGASSSMSGGSGDVFVMTGGTFTNQGVFSNGGTLQAGAIANSGTFTQSGPQVWSANSAFSNTGGTATISSDAGTTLTRNLSLSISGGTVTLAGPQHLEAISLTGGTLDVNGDVFLATESYAALAPLLAARTITTSSTIPDTAVALESGAEFLALNPSGLRNGQTVLPTDQLMSLTYFGDINLDGTVDLRDFLLMDASYLQGYNGVSKVAHWVNGDFNYDGIVDYKDYALADAAVVAEGNTVLADQMYQLYAAEFGQSYINAFDGAVPEPTSLLLLALGSVALLRHKNRR